MSNRAGISSYLVYAKVSCALAQAISRRPLAAEDPGHYIIIFVCDTPDVFSISLKRDYLPMSHI